MRKGLVLAVIVLFIVIAVIPSTGNTKLFDDITPPVTTHELDPVEPDGLNDWYVSDVNVTLNATDDISGVKEIHYRVAESEWNIHAGDFLTFILDHDCLIDGLIEYYAVDFAGNQEEIKSFCCIDIDQLPPDMEITYELVGGNPIDGWDILFTATATDYCSGLDRVEFYLNDVLQDTVTGPGPTYEWMFHYLPNNRVRVNGLIRNPEITEEYVNFYALIVIVTAIGDLPIDICAYAYDMAGNWDFDCLDQPCPSVTISPGFYLFQNLTLPNDYEGYIGRFFIFARFANS